MNVPRPVLVVNNAAASGNVGTVSYRFEVSDQSTFPNDAARTFTADGIAQGSPTTSWTLNRDLGTDVLWYWHARATDGATTSVYRRPKPSERRPRALTRSRRIRDHQQHECRSDCHRHHQERLHLDGVDGVDVHYDRFGIERKR